MPSGEADFADRIIAIMERDVICQFIEGTSYAVFRSAVRRSSDVVHAALGRCFGSISGI